MQFDAIVIGGSYAGLSAAMQLARARRSVAIVDAGKPRNRFAAASHGFFGQDGAAPRDMLASARAAVLAYPTVSWQEGEVVSAERHDGGFELKLASGQALAARRLVLAYGVIDHLPSIPGLAQRWGATVLHCPYCHGYEVAGRKLGVLGVVPKSTHQVQLIRDWGPTTLFLHEQPEPDAATLAQLARRGIAIERGRVTALEGEGKELSAVVLEDGRRVPLDALYLAPDARPASTVHEQLGCETEDGLLGPIVRADEKRATTVPGIFAAGDLARAFSNASIAAGDGVLAGVFAHMSLVFED